MKKEIPDINTKIKQLLKIAVLSGLLIAAIQTAEAKWYSVEMVIFSREAPSERTGQWPVMKSLPDWSHAMTIQPGVSIPAAVQTDLTSDGGKKLEKRPVEINQSAPYSLLAQPHLRLNAIKESLRRSNGRFTPLLHLAWRQPGQSRGSAKTLYLQSPHTGSTAIPKLQGTIKVSVRRYLHIDLDLILQRTATKRVDDAGLLHSNSFGPERTGYRFKTHRRMRSGELHYLDHPILGVILIIRPS